jgi:hypothetical protein
MWLVTLRSTGAVKPAAAVPMASHVTVSGDDRRRKSLRVSLNRSEPNAEGFVTNDEGFAELAFAGSAAEATGDAAFCWARATVALSEIDTVNADDTNSVLIERLMKIGPPEGASTLPNEYKGWDYLFG